MQEQLFLEQGYTGKDIVLFESVQGYESPEDAQAAFTGQYLGILARGMMTPCSTGRGKWISLADRSAIHLHSAPEGIVPQVLVPQHTQQELGIMGKNPVTELCLACSSYPIRLIVLPAVVDPCAPPVVADPCACVTVVPPPLYGFVLFNTVTGETDWTSIDNFDTPAAAMDAFYFFMMLLGYPGICLSGWTRSTVFIM